MFYAATQTGNVSHIVCLIMIMESPNIVAG